MKNRILSISDNIKILSNSPPDRPNIGLIIGKESQVVVDAGSSLEHAELIHNMVKNNQIKKNYVVLTHWHWDHTFGLPAFHNYESIANKEILPQLRWYQSLSWTDEALDMRVTNKEEIPFIRDCLKEEIPNRENLAISLPTTTYKDELELNLGGKDVFLIFVESDHTPDNSLVYSPEDDVLFLGDCLYPNLYENDSYTRKKFFSLLEKVKDFDVSTHVDSHQDIFIEKKGYDLINDLETIARICEEIGDFIKVKKILENYSLKYLDEWKEETAHNFLRGFY